KQYVTVIAGSRFQGAAGLEREWNYHTQQWRVLTFALGGTAKLPPAEPVDIPIADDPAFKVLPARASLGETVYGQRCSICHGPTALSGGAAPDLLRSAMPLDFDAMKTVLREGVLLERGMPRFEELSDDEIAGLQHFIRKRAREVQAADPRASVSRGHNEGQ
ncbi:MAG: c-type cytochrome, partial [Sphingomonadaceae bacterium]|nr:c-type cytochrome [Sphingomonadaceae bacterium]